MNRRTLMKTVTAAALALGLAPATLSAQEVTLRLHQFLPPPAPVPPPRDPPPPAPLRRGPTFIPFSRWLSLRGGSAPPPPPPPRSRQLHGRCPAEDGPASCGSAERCSARAVTAGTRLTPMLWGGGAWQGCWRWDSASMTTRTS